MFIRLAGPPGDMALSGDNVFTSAAATGFTQWPFDLNQIDIARIPQQQRLHEMSFNPVTFRSGWREPGPKQEPEQQQGLPVYGTRYYPVETQHTGHNVALPLVGKTEEGQPLTGDGTSCPSNPAYVSDYASTEPRSICALSNTNVTAGSELLDSSCWRVVTAGLPIVSSFAPHGGDPMWEHAQQGANASLLDYGHYTLGVHAGVLPQTVFSQGDGLHGMTLSSMLERDSLDHASTDSRLYASSDMLEAMVLSDEPSHPTWNVAPCDSLPCADVEVPGQQDSAWVSPAATGEEETVSPKMLRIRPTPTPTSSSESIRTSYLAGTADAKPHFLCPDAGGSKAGKPAVSKARKQLPGRGQRPTLHLDDCTANAHNMSRSRSTGRSDPPSPSLRKLSKLKPKPKVAPAPSRPSPPPASLASTRAQSSDISASAGKGDSCAAKDRVELADRISKDDFLVRHKQLGMTYKEIRRMGGFTEAESTLRGRYRTLTKSREARVRKPEWTENDLHLLEKGVRELAHSADLNSAKVPWKKVAEYIVAHGGSYHFGNSTCRKRWDELVREQTALGKTVRQPFYEQRPGRVGLVQGMGVGVGVGGVGYLPSNANIGGY
ncbi:hypothetical protein VTK56DRAFT_5102 [Thermocarpiscus australiensis]